MVNEVKKIATFPKATLQRYQLYIRILKDEKKDFISSEEIADKLNLQPELIRRDLTYLEYQGKPKLGYKVKYLLDELYEIFGLTKTTKIIVVGAGNLGVALVNYPGFKQYQIEIAAIFDNDPEKIGTLVDSLVVLPLEDMKRVVKRFKVKIGAICVPGESAPTVAKLMMHNNLEAIWNFAPVTLDVPRYMLVRNEDITGGLLILKHLIKQQAAEIS